MPATRQRPNPGENNAKQKLEEPYIAKSPQELDELHNQPSHDRPDPLETQKKLQDIEKGSSPHGSKESIEKQESPQKPWSTNVSDKGEKVKSSSAANKFLKKKGIWLLLGTGGISIFALFNTLIGPSFMLVNIASSVLTGDVAGIVSQVVEERKTHMANKQIRAINKSATTRCGAVPIKCRYKGMGPIQKKKLKSAGIEVQCGANLIPGRCNPKKFTDIRTGKSYGPKEFEKEMKNNPDFRNRAYNSFHKGVVMFYGGEAAKKLWNRFGIFRGKRPPVPRDDDPNNKRVAVRKLFRGMNANNGGELRAGSRATKTGDDPATKAENLAIDNANEQIKETDTYTNGYGSELEDAAQDPNKPVPPDPIDADSNAEVKGAVDSVRGAGVMNTLKGALVPTAIFDEFCRVKGIVKSVSAAKKVLASRQLIAYSFEFLRLANQIKAGDADGDTAQEISDLATYFTSKDAQGQSAFDSFGWNWGVNGKMSKQTEGEDITKYQLGGGGVASDVADTIPQTGCDITGNPIVQGTAVAVTLIPGVGQVAKAGMKVSTTALRLAIKNGVERVVEGGIKKNATKVAKNPLARMGAMQAFWMYAVPPLITNIARASTGTVVTGDEYGKDVGNAYISGFGSLNSSGARTQGMQPLTKSEVLAYTSEVKERKSQLAKNSDINQLDINTPDSFMNKTFLALAPTFSNMSISNFATKIGGLSLGSISNLTANTYADFQPAAYDICVDNDYEELGVAVDPFCNPQYGFSFKTINSPAYDAEVVADYMYDSGYISADGKPAGDYVTFLEKCVDTDELTDPECMEKDVKHTMFGLYRLDSSIYEDIELSEETGETTSDAELDSDWGGSKSVIDQMITPVLKEFDLSPGSQKRTPAENDSVGGSSTSDHLTTQTKSYATDYPTASGEQAARALAKRLGINGYNVGNFDRYPLTVDGVKFSVQILWAVEGHFDHIHVGVRREE